MMKHKNLLRITIMVMVMVGLLTACPKPEEISKLVGHLIVSATKEFIKPGEYADKGYTSVTFEKGSRLTSIGKGAFSGNSIKELTLPPSVTTIEEEAFEGNPIETLNLPDELITLGKGAFKGNRLKEVVLKGKIKELGENAFAHKEGASKALPTFKVSIEAVMKLVFSQFITDSAGERVLPTVEPTDEDDDTLKAVITAHKATVEGDTAKPNIVGTPAMEGSPKDGDTYKADENINENIKVSLTFSEVVYVSGKPQLTLIIGDQERHARYTSGSGSNKLIFAYTVQAVVDGDENGIEIKQNSLALNEGTIKDGAGNVATLTHDALAAQAGHKVEVVSGVTDIAITSTPKSDDEYKENEDVEVTVTFNKAAKIDHSKIGLGTKLEEEVNRPYIVLEKGDSRGRNSQTEKIFYTKGSALKAWIFTYTVQKGDTDAINTIRKIVPNGNTIQDAAGNNARLEYKYTKDAVRTFKTNAPSTKGPKVTAITVEKAKDTSGKGLYKQGDIIKVTLTFDVPVNVNESRRSPPRLRLKLQKAPNVFDVEEATFKAKDTNGKTLVFEHTVGSITAVTGRPAGYTDILILNNALILPSTTSITDGEKVGEGASAFSTITPVRIDGLRGKTASLDSTAIQDAAGKDAPSITEVKITSTPNAEGFYKYGNTIKVHLTFNKAVSFLWGSRRPRMKMEIDKSDGSKEVWLEYANEVLDGTGIYLGYYIDDDGFKDTDGIRIPAGTLQLRGASITGKDNGVALLPQHKGVNNGAAVDDHKVDSQKPSVEKVHFATYLKGKWEWKPLGIWTPYNEDKEILIKVEFTEDVKIDVGSGSECSGYPYLVLKVGDTPKNACADPDDDTRYDKIHWWKYTVQAGDTDDDGVTLKRLKFARASFIKDKAGNVVDNNSWSGFVKGAKRMKEPSPFRRVDTTPPTIKEVKLNSKAKTYAEGDKITVGVVFSEPITLKKPDDEYWHRNTADKDATLLLSIGGGETRSATMRKTVWRGRTKAVENVRIFNEIVFQYTVQAGEKGAILLIGNAFLPEESVDTILDIAGNELEYSGLAYEPVHTGVNVE